MSNIQKAFKIKTKHGLRMAVGGILGDQADSTLGKSFNARNAEWEQNAAQAAPAVRSAGSDASGTLPGQAGFNPAMQVDSTDTQSGQWGFNPSLVAQNAQTQSGAKIGFDMPAGMQNGPLGVQNMSRLAAQGNHRPLALSAADGVIVGADGLTDAQRAKKNAVLGNLGMSTGPAPAPQAPAPAPAPALAPAPQQAPSLGGTINSIRERQRVLGNLAVGGVVGAKTFEFEGKGTGTSDDIPVKVAGSDINVSDGEKAVVLPAKTAQNPQALDMIEDVIEQSNGKPVNRGLRNGYNLGGFVDDFGNLQQPNQFQKAVPNEILRQQVNNSAPGAQLRPEQTTAMAEKAAANRPQPKPPGPGVLNMAARAIGPAIHAYGAANSDIPAEQVSHGIKAGAYALNPWVGTGVDVVDGLVEKATGGKYNMATGLNAAAKWASDNVPGMKGDYMLPPELRPGGSAVEAGDAPSAAPGGDEQAANRAALLPPAAQTTTPGNYVPEATASVTPKLDTEIARRGLSGLNTIGTGNGNVTTGRDKNGQLHVMAGLDNTDAQNEAARAKEATRINADLARQVQTFDRLRAENLQESNVPEDRRMGLALAQQQLTQQQNRNHAADTDARVADAKEGRNIQREEMAQKDRQFIATSNATARKDAASASDAGIKDFDKLLTETGLSTDEQGEFRNWARAAYSGRKQKDATGKEVDMPGFEDMAPDERRAQLPNALALFALTKQANATEKNGRTSMAPPTKLRQRQIELNDVDLNSSGWPRLTTDNPNKVGLLGEKGYLTRKFGIRQFGAPDDQMIDAVGPDGKATQTWLRESLRNGASKTGPWGNMDVDEYLKKNSVK